MRYEVKDAVKRTLFRGDWDECIAFMKRVDDCTGPHLQQAAEILNRTTRPDND